MARNRNVEQAEAKILEWGARIEVLADRAEAVGDHIRKDYLRRINEIKTQRAEAQGRLDLFKAAGSETWEAFRTGIEIAWQDLETALKELGRDMPTTRASSQSAARRSRPPRSKLPPTVPKAPARHRPVNR